MILLLPHPLSRLAGRRGEDGVREGPNHPTSDGEKAWPSIYTSILSVVEKHEH
jgi:hypothetical protein